MVLNSVIFFKKRMFQPISGRALIAGSYVSRHARVAMISKVKISADNP